MGDEAQKLEQAAQGIAATASTLNGIVALLVILVIGLLVFVFLQNRNSGQRDKEQNQFATKQLELMGQFVSKLDQQTTAINNANEREVRSIDLLTTTTREYSNDVRQQLGVMVGALDKTLQNSITTVAVVNRIESGVGDALKKQDVTLATLGEARREIQVGSQHAEKSASGVNELALFVRGQLIELQRTINRIEESIAHLVQRFDPPAPSIPTEPINKE